MRPRAAQVAVALVALALVAGCGGSKAAYIPPGTYAGSTATDRAFTLDVGGDISVNRHKAKFVRQGVVEYTDGGVKTQVTCKVLDRKQEQLRCSVRTSPPGGVAPTTEVIDLMLL